MFVELHMIQNFGPSCLNRDDTNTPKDCHFGGFRRARISSQCLKRAIREYFNTKIDEFKGKLGVRTRILPKKIIELLVNKGKDEELSSTIVKNVIEKLGFSLDRTDVKKTDVLLFISNDIPEKIAKVILDNWKEFEGKEISNMGVKLLETISESLKSELDPDIGLFGRMVASKTDLNVDAASYVAHALSTNKVDMEMDFFTAIDDLQKQEEQGAGMMGTIMYNSSCFYRYSVIDLNQLATNLQGNMDYTISVLKGYILASLNAIPTGKQTSMASFNKPDFIITTIRSDQPWSLTNAFVTPSKIDMKHSDLINTSIEKLDNYLKDVLELYGIPEDLKIHFCATGERPMDYLKSIGTHHKSVQALIDTIGEVLSECNLA